MPKKADFKNKLLFTIGLISQIKSLVSSSQSDQQRKAQ